MTGDPVSDMMASQPFVSAPIRFYGHVMESLPRLPLSSPSSPADRIVIEQDTRAEPAMRFDSGKPRYDLIPPEALDELAKVYAAGAAKYADRNWERGMSWGRCFSSMMRHAWKFWRGQTHDVGEGGTGCHHMAHVMWNAAALLTYDVRSAGTDDRKLTG